MNKISVLLFAVLVSTFSYGTSTVIFDGINRRRYIYNGQLPGGLVIDHISRILKPENNKQHPYIAALEKDENQFCGSSIISEDVLITAAHCVYGKMPSDLQIRAGTYIRGDADVAPVQVRKVYNYVIHENYNNDSPKPLKYDIALILIRKSLKFTDYVKAIELADIGDRNNAFGKSVWIMGWGATEKLHASNALLRTTATLVPYDVCQKKYPKNELIDTMVCTMSKTKSGACRGDSGGPLVRHENNKDVLVGITSMAQIYQFTYKCDASLPTIYSDVAAFKPWILDAMNNTIKKMRKRKNRWLKIFCV